MVLLFRNSCVLLLLIAILFTFTKAQSTTDPPLYCSVFSLEAFSASSSSSGTFSVGSPVSTVVNTTYGTTTYPVNLTTTIGNNHLYLNLQPSSAGNVTFSVEVGFYVNGVAVAQHWITDSGGMAAIFHYTAGGNNILITPFPSSTTSNIQLLVTVNLTQVIIGPTGPNGVMGREDGCQYTDFFIITNPAGAPGNSSGFGLSSSSSGPGGVVGDPQFIGLRGQSFQIHGIDRLAYNLISDHDIQLNSRFTFLTGPRECPIMPSTGKKSIACWSHPGSYLTELGLKTSAGDRLHIVAGPAAQGFASITLNNEDLSVGSVEELHHDNDLDGSFFYNTSHEVLTQAGQFSIVIENVDGFVNLRSVRVHDWRSLSSHGLLGQTWRAKRYSGKVKEIQGDVDDYVILSDDIFGDDFVFNKHNVQAA